LQIINVIAQVKPDVTFTELKSQQLNHIEELRQNATAAVENTRSD
jgi:hypothetical protein